MSRYRRVEVGMWSDQRFRRLSASPPSARTLWIYLLCGPRTTIFPGLVVATEAVIADDLRWPITAELFGVSPPSSPRSFREAWAEIADLGMAVADWDSGVVMLPRALVDSTGAPRESAIPSSPNAFKGWEKEWRYIPDSSLKQSYLLALSDFARLLDMRTDASRGVGSDRRKRESTAYVNAYTNAFATHLGRVADASLTRTTTRPEPTRARARGPVPVPDPLSPDPDLGVDLPPREPPDPEPGRPREHGQPPRPTLLAGAIAALHEIAAHDADERTSSLRFNDSHPGAVDADPALIARRELGHRAWDRLNRLRRELAAELGLPEPMLLHDQLPGRRELADRLRESGASAELDLEHVFAIAEAEARDKRTLRWLSGSMFTARGWEAKLGMAPTDARGAGSPGTFSISDACDEATAAINARIAEGKVP